MNLALIKISTGASRPKKERNSQLAWRISWTSPKHLIPLLCNSGVYGQKAISVAGEGQEAAVLGDTQKNDSEYIRNDIWSILVSVEPLDGVRHVSIRKPAKLPKSWESITFPIMEAGWTLPK